MSTVNYDTIVRKSGLNNRYTINDVDNIDERRQRKQELSDSQLISKLVDEIGKKTAILTPLNLGKVALKKSNLQQAKEMGLPASQASKLDDVPDTSILASTIAPTLAGLTALNQLRQSKATEELQNQRTDYYKKALIMGTQGQSFNSMAPALAAMTTKGMMNSSLNLGGMLSIYELLTKNKLTSLSTEPLSYGNPGLIAAKMFGGIPGMGNAAIGGIGNLLQMGGDLTGSHGLNSVGGNLIKTAAGFDPTVASILSVEGLLGGMGTVGIGLGVNKLLSHIINKSPLNTSKTNRNKWNQQRYQFPSDKNHQAIQQYSLALSNIKTSLSTGAITSGEAQQLAALEKIVFNTALISDISNQMSDHSRQRHNRGVNTMNYIDKNIKDFDMSGKDLGNIFNGKLNLAQRAFFSSLGFMNSAIGSTNVVSNLIKSFKGQATDEHFWSYREAMQGYDKDAPLKQLGREIGQGLSTTRLLYATNLKTLIGDSKDPALTAAVTSAMLLQVIAQKSSSSKNMLGELHRLEVEQDKRIEAKQSWFIDTIVKGIDKTLQKTPIIGALMPLVHTAVGLGKFVKGIYNFADNLTNPNYAKGFTGFFKDIRTNIINSLQNENIKSEATMRAQLNLNKKSKQELVNDYFAGHFQDQMQELLELLGSEREPLFQDQYTGKFLTRKEAEALRHRRIKKVDNFMGEMNEPDTLMGMAGNWFKKKLFRIDDEDVKNSTRKMRHVFGLNQELKSTINHNKANNQFSKMSTNFNSWNFNSFNGNVEQMLRGIGMLSLASYKLFAGYLPYLKQIAECCPEKKANKNKTNGSIVSLDRLKSTNTNTLINHNQIEDRTSLFFKTFFEHIPNITKIMEMMKKKDPKSGMLSNKDKDQIEGKGLFGHIRDWFFGDADGKRKSRWSRIKDYSKDKYSKTRDYSKDKWSKVKDFGKDAWNKTKGFGSKTAEVIKSGLVRSAPIARAGASMLLGGAMGIARLGMGIATMAASGIASVGVLPALAIATLVAGAADYIFNDGKIMKSIWNFVADSEFGKTIGGAIDSLKQGWSDLKTWVSDGISNLINSIATSIDNSFTAISDGIYSGLSKIFPKDYGGDYFASKVSARNQAQNVDTKRQEQDTKEMLDKIKNATSDNEKIQIALSYKDRISSASSQEALDGILNSKTQAQKNYFGKELSWQNMKDQVPNFTNMDLNKQDEYIKSYAELKSIKNSLGMSQEDKAGYQQVDEMIRKIKEDMRKEYEAKNPVNKEQEQKALNESLNQMKETNEFLTSQIQSMVAQSQTVNGVLLKGFTEQMQSISGNQANLNSMMNSTARLMQKPNTVILDTTVAKLIPAIN